MSTKKLDEILGNIVTSILTQRRILEHIAASSLLSPEEKREHLIGILSTIESATVEDIKELIDILL